MRRGRVVLSGDSYTSEELLEGRIDRQTVEADPEPEFMGEPWGDSDHVPRDRRVVWDEAEQTYKRADDGI